MNTATRSTALSATGGHVTQWDRQQKRNRSTAARLDGYVEILTNHRRRLAKISTIYQDQPAVYPLQVEDTVRSLMVVRHVAGAARTYLNRLEPSETERIRPYGCIAKLASLDYLLTELLLTVAMFAEVCQVISPERVLVHMEIRAAFSALLSAYDDLLAQLSTLADKARHPLLPPGYEQIGEESWPLDHRWMTYASDGREVGVLVYADGMALSFYAMEEATTMLYVLLAYGDALLYECGPAYLNSPEHAAGLLLLWSTLPAKHLRDQRDAEAVPGTCSYGGGGQA